VIANPFALERQNAGISLRRFAEAAVGAGVEAARFDYRGCGESTGAFREASFSAWVDDLMAVVASLAASDASPVPVILLGLRVGGLLAAEAFARGAGDALLLWGAPGSGRAALTEVLRRRLATDFMEGTQDSGRESSDAPATREDYIRDLEADVEVEVEGYPWTRGLWSDAQGFELKLPAEDEGRPWLALGLNRRPPVGVSATTGRKVPVPRPPFWHHSPIAVPDLSALYSESLGFFERVLGDREDPGGGS
jgi:alpha/beta superfamily hydrolase